MNLRSTLDHVCQGDFKINWFIYIHKKTDIRPRQVFPLPSLQMFTQQIKFLFSWVTVVLQDFLKDRTFLYLMCMHGCSAAQSCPTPFHPMDHRPPGSSVNGIFPGNNTGACCHFLLQGIFLIQGSNPHLLYLLHWQVDFFTTSPPSKHFMLLINVKNLTQTTAMITGNSHLRKCMYPAEIPHLVSIYSVNIQIVPSLLLVLRRWQWAPCIHSLISQFSFAEWMIDNTQANTMCWGILITQEKYSKEIKSTHVGRRGWSAALLDREVVDFNSQVTAEQRPEVCELTMRL